MQDGQIQEAVESYLLKQQIFSKIESEQFKKFNTTVNNGFTNQGILELAVNNRGYTVNGNPLRGISNKVSAIGFFSGAGGLDIGAQLAGAKVISSLDFDKDSVETMKANSFFQHTQHLLKDIKISKSSDYTDLIKSNNPEKLILIGGPPCQPFSKGGYWITNDKRKANDDPRNMIGNYLRIIEDLQPDGFLLENVESILHPTNKIAVIELLEAVDKLGYNLITVRSNALDYGVPQRRKRVFFIASRKKIHGLPLKTHGSERDILINPNLLPHERAIDWIAKFDIPALFEKEELTIGKTYSEELWAVPPGMNYLALTERESHPNPKFIANKRFWNFLLKLHPNQPSWTISAQPGPWVGPFHWTSRRLRISEIAALQTFPEDYKFVGSRRSIQKQIGNAVPSLLGKAMVEHLIANI